MAGVCPPPRRRQALCVCDTRAFMFGGTHPHPSPGPTTRVQGSDREHLLELNDLWVLDLSKGGGKGVVIDRLEMSLSCPRFFSYHFPAFPTFLSMPLPFLTDSILSFFSLLLFWCLFLPIVLAFLFYKRSILSETHTTRARDHRSSSSCQVVWDLGRLKRLILTEDCFILT